MIDFYQTTNGDGWTNTTAGNQAWLINDPTSKVCDWFGVTVSADYKIQSIQLPNNNVRGEIPVSLAVLDDLKILDLPQNNLIGEIPVVLGNLPNLQTLNLRENVLVGAIPEAITNAAGLETLDLGVNRFSSIIPESIGNLQTLVYLDLSENKLEGAIPESLYTSVALEAIKLQQNNLSGGVSEMIGNLTELQIFWLSENNFSGAIPVSITAIPGLYSVHLDFNAFGSDLPLLIPSFSPATTDVQINNNGFVFSDFENEHPDYRDNLTNYSHIPQARVDRTETITVDLGDSAVLFTEDLTSPNNTYRWFKDSDFLIETTLTEISIDAITEDDLGVYYFTATNSTIEGLLLERNRITLALRDTNPGGGDCDVLEGVVDGSFESCIDVARTGNDEIMYPTGNLDCGNWVKLNPRSTPDSWLAPVNPAFSGVSDTMVSSPDGGVFAGAIATSRSGSIEFESITANVANLEIGARYEVTFYQASGSTYLDTIPVESSYSRWKVKFGGSNAYELATPMVTEETVTWKEETIEFVANATTSTLEFLASIKDLDNTYPYVYLLIDGIKVTKVDGDCDDGGNNNDIGFCLSQNIPTIGDLESPIEGVTDVDWYINETPPDIIAPDTDDLEDYLDWAENDTSTFVELPLDPATEILESATYWAQSSTSDVRVPLYVNVHSGITGFDVVEIDFQLFGIVDNATIADLEPKNEGIQWYAAATGGGVLPTSTLLEDGQAYFGQQEDNPCRFEVTVSINTLEPEGEQLFGFCESLDATVADLKDKITVLDNHELIFYREEIGSAQYALTDMLENNTTYYVAQRDTLGNESARKEIFVIVYTVPEPIISNTNQVFYTNDPVFISDLVAVGNDIRWYDSPFDGIAYDATDQLTNGGTYYAAQLDFNCDSNEGDCCMSVQRVGVTVTILEELPPTLVGCERFRPQPGDRYVISGWVRENGMLAVDPRTVSFDDVSTLFVKMLNYLLDEKILTDESRDRHIPKVYELESREFDVLIPFVKNVADKTLTIYNFEYIKERQYGLGPERSIGFSFALEPSDNALRFEYRTPYVRLGILRSSSSFTLGYRYPLVHNPELSLEFKEAEFCNGINLCVTSSFSISGLDRTGLLTYGYANDQEQDTNFSTGLLEEHTEFTFLLDPEYQVMEYTNALLSIEYASVNEDGDLIPLDKNTIEFRPKGNIVDGWQRISADFTIPLDATNMTIVLTSNVVDQTNSNLNVFFDDVRIHPFDGNMKSFVYDPITQRLVSELDENNYGTFYEYDQEGGLVRVKKETERGVFTVQETRSGNAKRDH